MADTGGNALNLPGATYAEVSAGSGLAVLPGQEILKRVGKGADTRYDPCFGGHNVGGGLKEDWGRY